jgi:glycosyltransferase involved in cell wall biosynthesis
VRVAVVGPTHPFKGGVAAHTTATAQHLADAGHDVDLVSWSRLYPARLYPGEQTVAGAGPDGPEYARVVRPLRWDRPGTWWRTGRRLAAYDLVVLVVVVPAQVPALLTVARAARGTRRPATRRPRVVVLAHNVVPHETHPGGTWLMNRLLAATDGVLVHSAEQERLARDHGARAVVAADLPPHPPGGLPDAARRSAAVAARSARLEPPDAPLRVLALGYVRRYKGFDLLVRAAAGLPRVRVTVAGEVWSGGGRDLDAVRADPRLAGRVDVRAGYVPAADLPGLLAEHDVLALPYRHATASQNVLVAHAHGLPVLATAVGTFGDQVRDGVDGLVVAPDDEGALVKGLERLLEPGVAASMTRAVPEVDDAGPWARYVEALTGLAAQDAA